MLQHDTPDDYVLATGKQYSVRDFVNASISPRDEVELGRRRRQ